MEIIRSSAGSAEEEKKLRAVIVASAFFMLDKSYEVKAPLATQ
jgi:hypothetical protein